MENLDDAQFEKIVVDGVEAIPERFLKLLENVEIVIADEPTPKQRLYMELEDGETLFGLYEGIPRIERGANYFGVLPDKITIFKLPILDEAQDETEAREIVRETVWHEIAHHFGMDEERVQNAEEKKEN